MKNDGSAKDDASLGYIADVLNNIDDDLVSEAAAYEQKKKNSTLLKWSLAAVACLFLLAAGGMIIRQSRLSKSGSTASADMIGFFIYQGNCYTYYETIPDNHNFIDKHLGTATGLIDEWTPQDEYVELSGSVKGDFYSIKGYDPSFMVCIKQDWGLIDTFICKSGLSIRNGFELLQDRLHLLERCVSVRYCTQESWNLSLGESFDLGAPDETMLHFIQQLNSSEVIPRSSLQQFNSSSSETPLFHIYFLMNDGITVHLRLFNDGYVVFSGLYDYFMKVDKSTFDSLMTQFQTSVGTPVSSSPNLYRKTIEDCMADPILGSFVPAYSPEGMMLTDAIIFYYLDSETGVETGTKRIYMSYDCKDNPHCYYSVEIVKSSTIDPGSVPIANSPNINLDLIRSHEVVNTASDAASDDTRINLDVRFGDVSVILSTRGVSAENVYEILNSI